MGLEEKAREYATKCHSDTNHMYGDKPYSYHLQMVRDAAKRFIGIIPEEDRDTDEYVKLSVNEILSRIDKATKKTAPPDEVVYHTSHGWSGFRD